MTTWVPTGDGTYCRTVQRARKERRCEECRRVLPVGEPYVEHRATMWTELTGYGRPYSIATCGIKTSDCPERAR